MRVMLRAALAVLAAAGLLAGGFASPADAAPRIVGFVDQRTINDPDRDGINNYVVAGWACVPAEPRRVLRIDIYDQRGLLFGVPANQQREPAIARACGGNAAHGFRVAGERFPNVVGPLRVYAVYGPGVNRLLPDS